jgi:hypothetical protein
MVVSESSTSSDADSRLPTPDHLPENFAVSTPDLGDVYLYRDAAVSLYAYTYLFLSLDQRYIGHKMTSSFQATYGHSKIAALNAAEAWVKKHNPLFDLIHVSNSFLMARG